MIIIKTEEFHRRFLYDLAALTIFKKEYLESIQKWDREGKLLDIGFGKQPSNNVKFFGSYFDKKIGNPITDVDVILLVNSVGDIRFYLRLVDILKNLDRTRFKFVRFYCGYIEGLQPPWQIGEHGDCTFNLEKVEAWMANVKEKYPAIYAKVAPYLAKDSISMDDLIKADHAIEPNISLTWTREEIIKGYKMHNGLKYDFRIAMHTYNRYRVMKFLYEYQGKYCLVDLNFVSRDKSIPRTQKDSVTYYTNDTYKKYKYLKKMLEEDKMAEFMDERKKAIGHITPLAAFVELFTKLKKYNIIPPEKLRAMEEYAKDYAKKNNINTIDDDKIQEMILEKITPLYEKYKNFIRDKYKEDIFVFNVRTLQLHDQVPKKVIIERQLLGYDCTLFPINIKQIKFLYKKAKETLLDPYTLYVCIHDAWLKTSGLPLNWVIDNIFTGKKYRITAKDDKYVLYIDNKEVKTSSKLKKLQLKALTGKN